MSQNGILADLALRISTNTAELTAGLDKAKNGINKFSKEAQERSKKVGEGFNSLKEGVANMAGGIQSKLSEVTGGISEMASVIPSVITGIKGMTAGMNLFKVALAGTGIGLLVIALASLIAYFMNTKEGADMLSQAMVGIKAIVAVVIDTFSGFGRVVVAAIKDPIGAIKGFGDAIKNFVTSKIEQLMSGIKGLGTAVSLLFEGKFKEAAKQAGKSAKDIISATNPVMWLMEGVADTVIKKYGEASSKAKEAIAIEKAGQKLRDEQLKWSTQERQTQVRISELKKKISQEDVYSAATRINFLNEVKALEEGLAKKRIEFAQSELSLKKRLDKLGENSHEDDKATVELQNKVLELKSEQQDKLEEIAGKRVELLGQQKGEVAEQQKLNEERRKELQIQKEYSALKKQDNTSLTTNVSVLVPKIQPTTIPYKVEVKGVDLAKLREKIQPLHDEYVAMMDAAAAETSAMINDSLTNAIAGFAEALGNIASGDAGGLKTFLNGILMMVLDFGAQFGKLLVSIGLAKVALEKIGVSGIGAVIAGGALIALTQVAKNFLSKGIEKRANGGYISGGQSLTLVGERGPELVNLPAGSHVTRANKTEQLLGGGTNITVTGRFEGAGETLLMVIDETKRRNGNTY